MLLAWVDATVDGLVTAVNFGLHAITLFMFSFYFIAQSPERFHRCVRWRALTFADVLRAA
jgi:hypothetical protein